MLLLITYDIKTQTRKGQKRLAKIAKECCNYGQRVQNSVFECDLDPTQLVEVRAKLLKIIDPNEDSLRIYNLGKHYSSKIEQYGAIISYDPEGELII